MKNKKSVAVVDNEENLAQGNNFPSIESHLNPEASVLMNYLRAYRGRNDYADIISTQAEENFWIDLERIKTALFSGDLKDAKDLLQKLAPKNNLEKAEYLVESARLAVFNKDYDAALNQTSEALKLESLPGVSRMTCHQLRGHALILNKNLLEAKKELLRCLTLSEFYPLAETAVTSRAFLVQVYSELGDRAEADQTLATLFAQIKSIQPLELRLNRLLHGIRAEVHLFRNFGEISSCRDSLFEAITISKYLNMGGIFKKSKTELAALILTNNLSPQKVVYPFLCWTFLPKRKLILAETPKIVVSTEEFPVRHKILSVLAEGPLPLDQLFFKVWNQTYDPLKDDTHLRANLSKVRRLLPPASIVTFESIVSLI